MFSTIVTLFAALNSPTIEYTKICEENTDHLSNKNKIEFYIGCSSVNNVRTYSTKKLEVILENR